ncbi:MAG TPA: hypothetical protein VH913_10045 [Hyphomicrobiaceae bacterium]
MRARLLTAAIALTVLVCGATVGLEAVGVLYPSGASATQEAEEHTQAVLARFETDLDSMVAPSGPVDLPNEAPLPWQDAGPATAAASVPDAQPATAAPAPPETLSATATGESQTDAKREAGEHPALAFSMRAEPILQTGDPAPPDEQPPPAPRSASEPEPVAVPVAVQAAPPARSAQPRSASAGRAASAARMREPGRGGWGCPVLDWLGQ